MKFKSKKKTQQNTKHKTKETFNSGYSGVLQYSIQSLYYSNNNTDSVGLIHTNKDQQQQKTKQKNTLTIVDKKKAI